MKPITLQLRTALILASLLAAGWTSQANVVGYVNVALTNGYNYLSNPLRASTNDCLTNLVRYPPAGSRAFVWDVTLQTFLPTSTNNGSGWNINYALPVGRGFVLHAPLKWTNTFVGEVIEGIQTNVIAGSNQYTLLGNKLPIGGPISALAMGGVPILDGASVHFFRSASQSFSDRYYAFTNHGWFDPKGTIGPDGPTNVVAESFFIQNPGPTAFWTNNFSLNYRAATTTATANITQLHIADGNATLEWSDPGGGPYDIRFSTDGTMWTTVATQQSGSTWTGKLPAQGFGRFQVVTSTAKRSAK